MKKSDAPARRIEIRQNGPYVVSGNLPLSKEIIGTNANRESVAWKRGREYPPQEQYALCRCGQSGNKPFCDSTHKKVHFDGTETAGREPYREQAEVMQGPSMSLTDAENLCAFARFCDPNGKVWKLVKTDDPTARRHFVKQTGDCPSGRLVAWDNETGEPIEPKLDPSIALVEDPAQECAGPIWVRGALQIIGSDGFEYELRNRVTLCRCGASQNKPFCDGSHASIKFRDE